MRTWLAALALLATPASAETVDQVAGRYKLAGEVLVAKGGEVLLDRGYGYGSVAPAGGAAHRAGERWRLASITKQVTAALIMRRYAGRLDVPMTEAMGVPPEPTPAPTLRQLLTHHSGLFNPDDTPPGAGGVPSFYLRSPLDGGGMCLNAPGQPGGPFRYNNCDYIVARGALGFAGGQPDVWPAGMTLAAEGELGVPGFVGGKPEPAFRLDSYGAAGGLIGTARAVFAFDRSLTTGKLLPAADRVELWRPENNGSYQALGQWVFPGQLKDCAAPKRIVQRDGEIGGVQTRNYILPDDDLIAIVFTNRSADDFAIGEVWEGKGFAHDLLSAAVAC